MKKEVLYIYIHIHTHTYTHIHAHTHKINIHHNEKFFKQYPVMYQSFVVMI